MSHKNKKVILTGASGAIGIAVIKKCYELGWDVCTVIRPGSQRNIRYMKQYQADIVECDLADIHRLQEYEICQNADYFIHLGWCGTFGEQRNDDSMQQKNVEYALSACEVASGLGCEAFLFAGSQAEFGRVEGLLNQEVETHPENAYGRAKLEAGHRTRELCKLKGMRHIYMRILSVYGPGDGLETMVSSTIRKLRDGVSPKFTPGEQLWDYLYSDDAAEALLLSCEKGKADRIYCLGSGTAKPLREYIEQIGKIVNPEVALQIGALPYGSNQVMHLCADITALQEDTGFIPKVEFAEGIRRICMEMDQEKLYGI